MDIDSFSVIEEEFDSRVRKIVWCTVCTLDRKERPRSRILHPIWEGKVGWIATGRETLKTKHLAENSYVSLSYWDPDHEQVYADCKAQWDDDPVQRECIWALFKSTPEPVGYDPGVFWKNYDDPAYGLLKLTPWRIELSGVVQMSQGKPPQVWRQEID
ncbi:MAG: pyridoxamine 5'-phosphate oxidase [Gammaproteobacteria bacterium]|jgi:general stress protein 26|nr:pyridoxamine 5'-phosphate oxidase [Gammaproteobacteria bacterium]